MRRVLSSTAVSPTWVWSAWAVWTVSVAAVAGTHEPWRDELQAWAIGRDATGPLDAGRLAVGEGHPPLWHLVLFALARVTRDPAMLQVTALACGSVAVYLVLRFMPVAFGLRCLLVAGYLPVFEWSTIARNYSLTFPLAVSAAVLLAGPPRRRLWALAPATLLAGTNVFAIPLAVAIGVVAIAGGRSQMRAHVGRVMVVGMAAVATAMVVLLWQRQSGVANATGWSAVAGLPAKVLLPLPPSATYWWGRTVWTPGQEAVLGLVIAVVATVLLSVSRAALVVWLAGVGGYLAAVVVLGAPVETRHASVIAVSLLVATWLALADPERRPRPGPSWRLAAIVPAAIVLVVSLGAAVRAVSEDIDHEFSGAPAAARWISDAATGPVAVLCATTSPLCSSVALTLDVPAYMTPDGAPFTWVDFSRSTNVVPAINYGAAVAELERRTQRDVFVVTTFNWKPRKCVVGFEAFEPQTEPLIVCARIASKQSTTDQ
jgi:hypothetical protein